MGDYDDCAMCDENMALLEEAQTRITELEAERDEAVVALGREAGRFAALRGAELEAEERLLKGGGWLADQCSTCCEAPCICGACSRDECVSRRARNAELEGEVMRLKALLRTALRADRSGCERRAPSGQARRK